MSEPRINYSIIIPHRNIPALLNRCLSSIPERDDLEIIIVDDNSSPEIVDFSNFPGNKRKDVTIIFDKSGLYAGHARNIGLKYAQGKWLLFADADDFFNSCINDVLDEYTEADYDIVFFNVNSVDSDDLTTSDRAQRIRNYIIHFEEKPVIYSNLLRYKRGEPWAKLIKRELVQKHHIQFEETIKHNDHMFSYLVGHYAQDIKVDKREIYCVTTRKGSTSQNNSSEALLAAIKVFGEAEQFYRENTIPSYVFWARHFRVMGALYYNDRSLWYEGMRILRSIGFSEEEIKYRTWLYSYRTPIGCLFKKILRWLRARIKKYHISLR